MDADQKVALLSETKDKESAAIESIAALAASLRAHSV